MGAEYDWLCASCFDELREDLALTVAPANVPS